jgi:hypothetical protein
MAKMFKKNFFAKEPSVKQIFESGKRANIVKFFFAHYFDYKYSKHFNVNFFTK